MQGVDCNDQLQAKYSLVKCHGMKKYYHKMMLSLIDFTILQAEIHSSLFIEMKN